MAEVLLPDDVVRCDETSTYNWLWTRASLGHRLEQLREVERGRLRVELAVHHAVRILPATPKAPALTHSMDTA